MAAEDERQGDIEQPEQVQDSGQSGSIPAIYLWQSIVVTLLCCLPLGIPAIVFAAQTNSHIAAGNMAEAQKTSEKARTWCWIAFAAGIVGVIGFIVVSVFMGGLAAAVVAAFTALFAGVAAG